MNLKDAKKAPRVDRIPTKTPELFSLDGLIRWLEKQRSETPYCWASCEHCLIANYLRDHGHGYSDYTRKYYNEWGGKDRCFYQGAIAIPDPQTYGGALQRAREIRDGSVNVPPRQGAQHLPGLSRGPTLQARQTHPISWIASGDPPRRART